MRSVGGADGLDITQDMKPPKSLYIQVSAATPPPVGFLWVESSHMTPAPPTGEVSEGPRRVRDWRRHGGPAEEEQPGGGAGGGRSSRWENRKWSTWCFFPSVHSTSCHGGNASSLFARASWSMCSPEGVQWGGGGGGGGTAVPKNPPSLNVSLFLFCSSFNKVSL